MRDGAMGPNMTQRALPARHHPPSSLLRRVVTRSLHALKATRVSEGRHFRPAHFYDGAIDLRAATQRPCATKSLHFAIKLTSPSLAQRNPITVDKTNAQTRIILSRCPRLPRGSTGVNFVWPADVQ